jgi:hypothetical protein
MIAADIGYSEHTVSNKTQRLCKKLGVDNSVQAVARASAAGLLHSEASGFERQLDAGFTPVGMTLL